MKIDKMTHLILGEGFNGLIPIGRAKEISFANVKVLSLEFQEIPMAGRCMVVRRDELPRLSDSTRALIKKAIIDESRKENE
tara:strand:+ start:236 stop:478 length:243 start_codon:yes stop_codon:yes gene_type:complete